MYHLLSENKGADICRSYISGCKHDERDHAVPASKVNMKLEFQCTVNEQNKYFLHNQKLYVNIDWLFILFFMQLFDTVPRNSTLQLHFLAPDSASRCIYKKKTRPDSITTYANNKHTNRELRKEQCRRLWLSISIFETNIKNSQ